MRVTIISPCQETFKSTLLDYARDVEKITTSKRDNLI
jgi:hypothetical protein